MGGGARLQEIARIIDENGGVAAAICLAPVTLARAGLLEGISATGIRIRGCYGRYDSGRGRHGYGEAVVVDGGGRMITGSGPSAAEEFGVRVVQVMQALDTE